MTFPALAAIAAQSTPQTAATLAFDAAIYPSMAPTAGNGALLQRLNHINKKLEPPEFAELDPLKREAVVLSSISRQAKRAAILMPRLAAEKR